MILSSPLASARSILSSPSLSPLTVHARLAGKTVFAVTDQALFSGTNFALSIFLARSWGASEYGAFALAFAIFLFVSGFYASLVLEPMSVFGPAKYRDRSREYQGAVIILHWILSLPISGLTLVLILGPWVDAPGPTRTALAGLAASSPAVLFWWLVRRMFYLQGDARGAALGNLCYAMGVAAGIAGLSARGSLSLPGVFAVLGVASLAASILGLRGLRGLGFDRVSFRRVLDLLPRPVVADHWGYGRWSVAATFAYWSSGGIYYALVAGLHGLEETAALRAMQNLFAPISQVVAALGLLLLPWAAGRFAGAGRDTLAQDARRISAAILGLTAAYCLVLWAFRHHLVHVLYAGKYAEYLWLVPYLGAMNLMGAMASGWHIGLRAALSPRSVLAAYALGAAVSLVVAFPLVAHHGLAGAAAGSLIGVVVQVPMLAWCWRRVLRARDG